MEKRYEQIAKLVTPLCTNKQNKYKLNKHNLQMSLWKKNFDF